MCVNDQVEYMALWGEPEMHVCSITHIYVTFICNLALYNAV